MNKAKKTAALYVRVNSSLEEAEKQLEELWIFAESNGFIVTDSYYEITSGAAHVHERTIWHLLKDAEQHKFDTVVIKDISRISRKATDALFVLNALQIQGIDLLTQHGVATLPDIGMAL